MDFYTSISILIVVTVIFGYIDKFWELVDKSLNAILFILIGFELLVIHIVPTYILIGILTIIIVLVTRNISVFIPAQFIKLK